MIPARIHATVKSDTDFAFLFADNGHVPQVIHVIKQVADVQRNVYNIPQPITRRPLESWKEGLPYLKVNQD